MEVAHLVEFGNTALFLGKDKSLSELQTYTEQERDFCKYLYSDERHLVLNTLDSRVVHPVDIKFFFKIGTEEKNNEKPN